MRDRLYIVKVERAGAPREFDSLGREGRLLSRERALRIAKFLNRRGRYALVVPHQPTIRREKRHA